MTTRSVTVWEKALDGGAALLLAGCVAASLWQVEVAPMGAVGGAAVAGALALVALGRVRSPEQAPGFALVDAEFIDPADDELLLEDELEVPPADSQVVRLFAVGGGTGASVPGELKARIDQFLDHQRAPLRAVPAQPDAAQELYEALAGIRRTLR